MISPLADKRLAGVLLVLITLLSYLPALRNGFVYDDHFQLERNPYIRDFQHIELLFTTDVWHFSPDTRSNNYRPLHMISYLFLYQFFGLNPVVFHAVALVLYAFSVLLFWHILKEYTGELAAFAGALFWALHPVHVESVAWIGSYPDLLCGFFLLLAFLLYRKERLVLSLVSYLFALFSKETALIFPLVILTDHLLFRKHLQKKALRWIGGAVLGVGIYAALRVYALGSFLRSDANMVESFSTFISAIAFAGLYLSKLIFPLELNAFYHFTLPLPLAVSWAGYLLFAAALFFMCVFRRKRVFVFGMLWFFILLGPALVLRDVSPVLFAERYLYLPAAGFVIALISLSSRRSYLYTLIGVSLLFAILTFERSRIWRDDLTLWSDTVEKSPASRTANYNLGTAYMKQNDFAHAAEYYRRVVRLDPGMGDVYYNLAICEYNLGNRKGAADSLQDFLKHARPDHPLRKEALRRLQQLSQ